MAKSLYADFKAKNPNNETKTKTKQKSQAGADGLNDFLFWK